MDASRNPPPDGSEGRPEDLETRVAPAEPRVVLATPSHDEETSILEIISILLKHRRWIFGFALASALVVIAVTLLSEPTYTSRASFLPQEGDRSRLGGAAALAGQLGIAVSGGEPGRSPQFYADLLRSREILSRILGDSTTASSEPAAAEGEVTGTLAALLGIEEESAAVRREEIIGWLREEAVSSSTNRETGLVEVEVTTPWPEVSREIARRLLELLNDFNLQRRQSQAQAERSFVEARLADAREELLNAEERLRQFLDNNRQFQNSPQLVFEHDRLRREVAVRQEIFVSLSQSYEEARISEVRNTPIITVVERPETPVEADPRHLAIKGVAALLVGALLGVLLAFVREIIWRRREEGTDDYREFYLRWNQTKEELRRPLRRLTR